MTKLLVLGAGGNLGRRVVARGCEQGCAVTALVRDRQRFLESQPAGADALRIVEGDARDGSVLRGATEGQDAVVSTAGNVADGEAFSALFADVVSTLTQAAFAGRVWMLAGAGALTIPHANVIGIGLPGVPKMYAPHAVNWRRLEASPLDWALMCPGPMVAAPDGRLRDDLRVSLDVMPYEVPGWAGWAPKIALSLVMKSKTPELVVSYEDVAAIMLANLSPGDRFSRRRVGVALPAHEEGRKEGWTSGRRGPDA